METRSLSPLAKASHDLVLKLAAGGDPATIEAGCRELLTQNTNGRVSADTRVVEVASEIVRGVLAGAVRLRSPSITAATKGISETGPEGEEGDAERLDISERACRDVRDSYHASASDYTSALEGAAPAAKMDTNQLRERVDAMPPGRKGDQKTGLGVDGDSTPPDPKVDGEVGLGVDKMSPDSKDNEETGLGVDGDRIPMDPKGDGEVGLGVDKMSPDSEDDEETGLGVDGKPRDLDGDEEIGPGVDNAPRP